MRLTIDEQISLKAEALRRGFHFPVHALTTMTTRRRACDVVGRLFGPGANAQHIIYGKPRSEGTR